MDWVDVMSALKADPAETAAIAKSLSDWPLSSAAYFAGVQKKLKDSIAYGQYSIFTNGYWGHPAYKLPPEVNLLGVAHYLQALVWQRDMIKSTPSWAARTRTRTSWSAAWPAPST